MQVFKIGVIALIATLFISCQKHCRDFIYPSLSQEALDYYLLESGDTLYFQSNDTDILFNLSQLFVTDTITYEDNDCIEGIIPYSVDGHIHSNAYYDTIYFNQDGFLKFISSQYGYVLERLP